MSLVGLVMFRNMAMRNRHNSAANIMNANQALTNAAGNASNISFGSAHAMDKNLELSKANSQFMYKANSLMQESAEKQLDKEIKRSFNVFA